MITFFLNLQANSSGGRLESVTSEDIQLLVSGSDQGEDTEMQKWHLVHVQVYWIIVFLYTFLLFKTRENVILTYMFWVI